MSDDPTLLFEGIEKEHWKDIGKIHNKNIKSSIRPYHIQRSSFHRQQPPKHFEVHFILYEIYGFHHINKDIFELPL